MKKFRRLFPGLLAAAALLAGGCVGSRGAETTTLYVDEDGVLEQAIVEAVEEDGFTQEELRTYVREDVEAYGAENGEEKVTLESCRLSGGTARITLKYASAADYASYNQVECFLGTVQEAKSAGYSFEGDFLDGSGNAVENSAVQAQPEAHVLILEEVLDVRLPGEILYTSADASVSGERTVSVKAAEDAGFTDSPVYIIYQ